MTLQITGKLHSGTATVQKSEKFSVRNFVLEITESAANGQTYTNYADFQLVNNNCGLLDQFAPGQMVTVHFNLRGNFWNDKVITNLQAWKIELAHQQPQAAPTQWAAPTQPAQQQPAQWGAQPAAPAQQPQTWAQQAPQPETPSWPPAPQPNQPQPF